MSTSVSNPSSSMKDINPVEAMTFAKLFLKEINNQDINELLTVQRTMLEQLDEMNEKLDDINKLSAKRVLKTRLNKKYPDAFSSVAEMNLTQQNS
ncbi:unnamed protein product [Didymodactylos carnosus]|uniref:Uncharacterized protein n=1 Tax=Didymodactylos carnosus TaxID=1234261 RepID=A0A813Y154_9BILA|nr:unnamed protein product [Didymodactylos carnosus]CAF0873291.1 unnamed protein product [Didymodactylos carnosus]CAF3617687.1 unnamed protein product [Didymodactylos carnosus]CAF3660482.1 unnamed protein product [Didymodactylos carnosus]